MKSWIAICLSLGLFLSLTPVSLGADQNISVFVDGNQLNLKILPISKNGRTLVPMRAIFEELGAKLNWDEGNHIVTATKGSVNFSYQIGQKTAIKNGEVLILDTPGIVVEDSTFVPVRFIAEALGATTGWDEKTKTVIISSIPKQRVQIVDILNGMYVKIKFVNQTDGEEEEEEEVVRLAGISPIHDGMEATSFIKNLLPIGSEVLLEIVGKRDRNKNLHGAFYLSNGTFVNAKIVSEGLAKKSLNLKDDKLDHLIDFLQKDASANGRGFWKPNNSKENKRINKINLESGNAAVVTEDGSLWTWGQFFERPTRILDHVKDVKVDGDEGIALRDDGTVWVWGFNNAGLWGTGEQEFDVTITPRQVEGLKNIVMIELMHSAAFAIDQKGIVYAWGSNFNGKLGVEYHNNNIIYSKPFINSWSDVRAVSPGFLFTVILKNDGTVWTTQPYKSELIQMKELTDIIAISSQNSFAIALKKDGTVWGWGKENNGIFGGGNIYTETPKKFEGLENIKQINAGSYQAIAINNKGELYGWGSNEDGQFGASMPEWIEKPMILDQLSPVLQTDVSVNQLLVLKKDGTLWGGGYSPYYIFGDETYKDSDGINYHRLAEVPF
jgi:alpha-tubulin suppressor-like RCC1 family protein